MKDREINLLDGLLPIEALEWFPHELEKLIEISSNRLAIFMSSADDMKNSDDNLKQLANAVVTSHKKTLEDIDEQLLFWLSLELTDTQQEAVQYCQSLAFKLHHIQAMFEQNDPMTDIHLQ